MARIRTVKPEFFKHEDLFMAEKEDKLPLRIAFCGLWCIADREGRFKWKPNQIKLDVLPYDSVDFSRVLDALATRGFIVQYSSEDGEIYGFIPNFGIHQVINNRETQSLIPCPFDASSTRDPRGLCMLMGKGKERKGKEVAITPESKPKETTIPDEFSVSENVKNWADKNGHSSLNKHLDHFINVCKAKGYKYLDWDRAFMGAISKNWADVKSTTVETEKPDWMRGML